MELFDQNILFTGLMTGLVYAVLATGLVLVYRATKVINFAYGDIGAIGAGVLAKLVLDFGWNYWLAFVLVLLLGGGIGALFELGIVRRLFHAPRLILLVATIGASQLLFFVAASTIDINNQLNFPTPVDRSAEFFGVLIFPPDFLAMALMPAAIAGIAIFLNRTPYGIGVRASAENGDAARLAGISVKRLSTLVWVLSGVLATVTILVYKPLRDPTTGIVAASFGPSILLRALAAGLVGKLVDVRLAVLGGLGLGLIEAVLLANVSEAGIVNVIFAILVVVLVLVRGKDLIAGEADGTSSGLATRVPALPRVLQGDAVLERLPLIGVGLAVVAAVVLPQVFGTPSQILLFSRVCIYAIIGLSVVVLTGWSGQLSLGQFGFVGLGAVVVTGLVNRGMPFGIAVAYAVVAAVLAAIVVGLPALRVRGLFLAVTTLGFAVAVDSWVVRRPIFVGDNTAVATVSRPSLGPIDFRSQTAYYYLCLAVLVIAALMIGRLRRTGIGRSWIAVRDNPNSASAFTISTTQAKLSAFAVSGGLAGLAGGLLAGLIVQISPNAFPATESLRIVAMAIIGGIGSVAGAVLGAMWVVGLPVLFADDPGARALTSGPMLLLLLLYFPGGLHRMLVRGRTTALAALARRRVAADPSLAERKVAEQPATARAARVTSRRVAVEENHATADSSPPRRRPVPLEVSGVEVAFGGRRAVAGVDLEVRHDEIVGLIGSNGAGKSTLMNAISGFVPATGSIRVHGIEVGGKPPHHRSRLGIGRAFQDARLFGDLTVRESLQTALEGRERSELVPSMFGYPPARRAERQKDADAADLIDLLGLGRYADVSIASLSTGTRRIAELGCLLALDTNILLLDEPTAGVAQKETEVFGPLIRRIQRDLGASVLIIEHDIPLIMSISDRVYCMSAGEVIASGDPEAVRNDPKVVATYLGTDERAIERSNQEVSA